MLPSGALDHVQHLSHNTSDLRTLIAIEECETVILPILSL
jgi:hypothetical protein